jgi:hypothetical protein
MELREELFLLRGYVWLSYTIVDMLESITADILE